MSKDWQAHARHILDAIAKVRRIEQRGSLLDDDVLYLKAQIYKKQRNYLKAITAFEKILADYKEEIRADNALFEMADIYETRLDEKDKAKELYEKLFTEFTDSSLAVEARKRFRILRGDKIGREQ